MALWTEEEELRCARAAHERRVRARGRSYRREPADDGGLRGLWEMAVAIAVMVGIAWLGLVLFGVGQ